MKTQWKLPLVIGGLLVLVVICSYFYSLTLRGSTTEPVSSSAPAEQEIAPAAVRHPDLEAGLAALRDDRLDEAQTLLEGVPSTDPSYLLALHNLAGLYLRQGKLESSAQALERLNTLQPDDAALQVSLGWAYFRLRRYPDAELEVLRALEVAPDHLPARFNVALFRVAQGKLPEAIRAYERAMAHPDAAGYVERGRRELAALVTALPGRPETHYALAYLASKTGSREEEIRQLERYLEMGPEGDAVEVARERLTEALATVQR
jgi:tetratricopeptide (TPR) repeat protein